MSSILIMSFMILRIYFDEPIGDLMTIVLTGALVVSLYRGYYTESKSVFIVGIMMGLIALGLLVTTLLSQYGVY